MEKNENTYSLDSGYIVNIPDGYDFQTSNGVLTYKKLSLIFVDGNLYLRYFGFEGIIRANLNIPKEFIVGILESSKEDVEEYTKTQQTISIDEDQQANILDQKFINHYQQIGRNAINKLNTIKLIFKIGGSVVVILIIAGCILFFVHKIKKNEDELNEKDEMEYDD